MKIRTSAARLTASVAAILALAGILSPAGHAQTTASPVAVKWACAATAVTAQVLGGDVINPVKAGRDDAACAEDRVGIPNAAEALNLDPGIRAFSAYAITLAEPGKRPMDTKPVAQAGVEGLAVGDPTSPGLGVDAARSEVKASCENGKPKFETSSVVASITLGGTPIVLDGVVQPITDALSDALGVIIEVRLNEQVALAGGGIAVRAARVSVLKDSGPVLETIIAESRIETLGAVCDPNAPGNGGSGGGDGSANPCPPGSVYDLRRNLCIIAVPGSQTPQNPNGDLEGPGSVIVGVPYSGPKGGRVISVPEARKRYKSPCLRGPGPRYAVIGTNGRNRITGTNRADRILGLGGRDRLDGGRGNDCIDGGSARDVMTGGQDNDRVYGFSGNDSLNGDTGHDRLHGGTGNDTHVGAYGADHVWAGPGNDKINVAVAGRIARIRGGTGYDIARVNPEERRYAQSIEKLLVVNTRRS